MHLSKIKGLEVRVFGEPMSFWDEQMPRGMYLRSGWSATHTSDPWRALTLEAFRAASGIVVTKPAPIERFIEYGLVSEASSAQS